MIKDMKGLTLKQYMLSALILLNVLAVHSQNGNGSMYDSPEDSITCGQHLSAYRDFFKYELYEYALLTWSQAFNDCPASSERMYIDGVTMYRSFIKNAPDGPVREGLIDTLMLIYDRRIENFEGEGNVIGRKGKDLLTFSGGDIKKVENAYAMLKKSIELEGNKSRDVVMLSFVSAGIGLNKAEVIDDSQIIEDYMMVVRILDKLEGRSSRWKRTRETIDEIMLKEDMLSCEALDTYYAPKYEEKKDDKAFLEELVALYAISVCERSDTYVTASENLYSIAPGPESAHNLAVLFITRNDLPKAINYLKMAVLGESLENETRAEWNYELAVVSFDLQDHCEAIAYAREAIVNKSDLGKAYMILGDAVIASRSELKGDFEQRAAYWVASDMFSKASTLNPSLADEARQKLSDSRAQYPNKEEVFFRDFKDGDSYQVGGCINEYTTVRAGK
jgi:hypothetical protein